MADYRIVRYLQHLNLTQVVDIISENEKDMWEEIIKEVNESQKKSPPNEYVWMEKITDPKYYLQ